jgi:hypothetical protein
MIDPEYASLTDLGRRFGATSRECGGWLAGLGLRIIGGDPTEKAHDLGITKQVPISPGDNYHQYYIWHVAKTVRLLEGAGHKPLPEQNPPAVVGNLLVGPFTSRINSTNGFEIMNGDGNVFCWVIGEKAAKWVAYLLNLAEKHGKL